MCVSTCPRVSTCVRLPTCHMSTHPCVSRACLCVVCPLTCVSTRPHVLGSCVVSWLSYRSGNSREGPNDPLRPRARLVARDPEVGGRLVAFPLTGGEGGALGPWAEDP